MGRLFYLPESNLRIFCMYTKNTGVVAATPPGTRHIAHATYLNENAAKSTNRSNIDYFLIQGDTNEEDIFGRDIRILHGKELRREIQNQNPSIEELYGVQFKIMNNSKDLTPIIKRIGLEDIYTHMIGKNNPKIQDKPSLEYVRDIPSTAKIIIAGYAQIDIDGKQTFYPNCAFDLNLDDMKHCKSGVSPDGKVMPWGACFYCYASFKHTGYPYIFKVEKEVLIEQLKEARLERDKKDLPTRYLRLGKRTEFGAFSRENIINTLEACVEEKISVVFPTKYLRFDKEIAKLLKKTNSTLLPSLGDDNYELGAVMHGCNNEYRFEQGFLFQEAGVRVIPYILVRAHEEDGGEIFGKNLRKAEKFFGKAQILPIISKNIKVAQKVLGGSHDLVGIPHNGFSGETFGGYEIGKGRRGVPIAVHSSIEKRIGNNNGNIRLCLHNSQMSHCGKCFLPKEKGESIPAETVNLKKSSRWVRFRDRYHQEETLFDLHSPSIKREKGEPIKKSKPSLKQIVQGAIIETVLEAQAKEASSNISQLWGIKD